jgi:bifunctional DNA-binding transcriptional regulator/antitoxin component of YhaV-PrlF toxin-antitoxin module
MLDRLGLKAGDALELRAEDGEFHMRPVDEDMTRQLEIARQFMDKYKVALKKLAE